MTENKYGYKVCYVEKGKNKVKVYMVTNTCGLAEWFVRWYEREPPPDRKTNKPLQNVEWEILPITTYLEYKRRWRGCPF